MIYRIRDTTTAWQISRIIKDMQETATPTVGELAMVDVMDGQDGLYLMTPLAKLPDPILEAHGRFIEQPCPWEAHP